MALKEEQFTSEVYIQVHLESLIKKFFAPMIYVGGAPSPLKNSPFFTVLHLGSHAYKTQHELQTVNDIWITTKNIVWNICSLE